MRVLHKHVLVALGSLGVLLTTTFLYIRMGQPSERLPLFDYTFFPLVLVGFTWANWSRFKEHHWPARLLASGFMGLLAMAIWFIPAMLITLYFHIGWGGRL